MADEKKETEKAPEKKSMKERSKPQVIVEGLSDLDATAIIDPESLDPEYNYRFVQKRPQRLARVKMKGYEPVDRDEVELLTDQLGGAEEEKIIHGDVILMKAPKDLVARRRKEVKELNERRIRAPEGSFRKKAASTRVGGLPVRVITTEGEEE